MPEKPVSLSIGNWPTVRFGDVVRNCVEATREPAAAGLERCVGMEHLEPGSLKIRGWGLVAEGTSFSRVFRKGQVLFGKRRAYQRKVAVADFDGICSSDILVFEPKGEELIPELLPFVVQSDGFFNHALGTSAGSLSPRTRWSQLAQYEFPLPPKDEQRRIAEILWAAEETIEGWAGTCKSLSHVKDAVLDAVFCARGGQASCQSVPLYKAADIQTGLAKGRQYADAIPTREVPYLRVANVQDGFLDLKEVKTITVAECEVSRYLLQTGDVLITEGGDFDKVGRGTIWRGEIAECLHQNHVFGVRPKPGVLLSEFLAYQTGSRYGKSYFLKCAKKTSNLASINATQVRNFPLRLPSIEEQRRVVNMVGPLETRYREAGAHLLRVKHVRKGILACLIQVEGG